MPLFWMSLALILGILAADGSGWGPALWAGCAAAALLVWGGLRRFWRGAGWRAWLSRAHPRMKLAPLLLLAGFGLGGLRYAAAHLPPGPGDLAYYNGAGELSLRGWVAGFPDRRDRVILLRVRVEEISSPGSAPRAVRGDLLVMLAPGQDFAYGQRLELRGRPADPPEDGDFSYRDYLARRGIYTYLAYPRLQMTGGQAGGWLEAAVFRLRAAGLALIARLYPAPESELLSGILLGVDAGMPAALASAFQATGVAHIIAISGFNMVVLSGLFLGLFGRLLTRWWAALAAVLALAGYSLLAGGGASVVRAAIMCGLAIAAAQIGRSSGAFNALLLSAGVMCLFDPNLPWDVSFQLSFAATAGLMLYAGPLQGGFAAWAARRLPQGLAERLVGPVGEYFLCTLAAQLTTLPLIVWHFGRLSLSSLAANPLVLPVQAPLMVFGGLSVLLGLVWQPLGRGLALLAWPLAAYTDRLVEWLARIPAGQIVLGPEGSAWVAIGCGLVILAALLRERLRPAWVLLRPALALLALGGLAVFVWRAALALPDGRLHLTLLDLPGGPALLIRAPQGQTLLSGGAEAASALTAALGRRLPPAAAGLDGLLLAGPGGWQGLAGALEVYPPARVFSCAGAPSGRLGDWLEASQLGLELLSSGRALRLDGETRLEVAGWGEEGCALRLTYGRLQLLLPGGLLPQQIPASLRAPNVLAIGADDPRAWREAGLRVLEAPPGGWLELQSDGVRLWVESGR